MFLPIRTDRRLKRTPWVNYTLIVANLLVYALTSQVFSSAQVRPYMLTPSMPQPWQFVTYQFLHHDLMHVGGNMLFLYVFGNSVEDRLGRVAYLLFYLAGGVIAGLGHAMLQSSPVLGASGAVCAVTGAYLALFPLSNVTVVFWFFVGGFEISSFALIIFQMAQDLTMALWRSTGVAYLAHISGYAFGFTIGMALLLTRLLPREPYDLITMIEHRRRRSGFRALAQRGYQPWESQPTDGAPPTLGVPGPTGAQQQRIMALRSQITATAEHDLSAAADLYANLLEFDPGQVLSQQLQLDIANQLMSDGRYDVAARAYELFLGSGSGMGQREQIELILALIYTRYLDRRQRAKELLTSALPRLHDPQQVALARQTLEQIG